MCLVRGFRRPDAGLVLGAALLLTLAACGPDPTPLPVLPVATTPAPETTVAVETLPALAMDSLTLRLLPPAARDRLSAVADLMTVERLADAGSGPLVSVQPFDGGALTAYGLNVAAQLNSGAPPLDDPALRAALTTFLMDRQAEALRLALANAGYPDGLTLTVATDAALLALATAELAGPIRWQLAATGTPAHVTVAAGADADAIIGQGGLLIGALPLYARGWQVGRGDDGLPLFTAGGD